MNYYREVAFALRVRGMSESEIGSTLRDIRAHVDESGQEPLAQFGDPEEFAGRFEQRTSTTTGRRFVIVMTVLALVSVIALFIVARSLDVPLRIGALSIPLFTGVIVLVIGFVGGFVLDRRLPRGSGAVREAPRPPSTR
jgi:hypothetical protein